MIKEKFDSLLSYKDIEMLCQHQITWNKVVDVTESYDLPKECLKMTSVRLSITFVENEDHEFLLQVQTNCDVKLMCQRCMTSFVKNLSLQKTFCCLQNTDFQSSNNNQYELLPVEKQGVILKDVVFSEIMLAIPIAPKHADERCSQHFNVHEEQKKQVKENSPFDILAGLPQFGKIAP